MSDTQGIPNEALRILRLNPFEVIADLQPSGRREHRFSDAFLVSISVGRRGLDERGFVVEVHELIDRVKRSFEVTGDLGPQAPKRTLRRRGRRAFVASCEQVAYGVARVVHDMLEDDLDQVIVSVTTSTGLATFEWNKGDPRPVFPRLVGDDQSDVPGDIQEALWVRHFSARDVEVLLAENFRCGTPEGVEDSFRCEVSLTRRGLDADGVVINGQAFNDAVTNHFHPHGHTGTPEDAPRTEGGSRVFVASCERLASGVAHVAYTMLGDNLESATVSVQNATGMVTYRWKSGDAAPVFPSVADQALTDRTYKERQAAIREGRSAGRYC